MSKKPVSPLRQRLIDDITARRFSEDTKRDYVRNVRKFAAFLGRSPDTATSEDLRRYQLHMAQQQASPSMINAARGLPWRSPTCFALMGRRGGRPTPVT